MNGPIRGTIAGGVLFVSVLIWGFLVLPCSAQPLLPEEAVRRALTYVPELKKAHALTEAAQAYSSGAGAQPNPVLQLSAGTGDRQEGSNSLSQTLEIAGQPGLRRKAADETVLARAALEEALRREVSLETAKAYYDLWEKDVLTDLARTQYELAHELESVATERLELGEISVNEHLRVKLFVAQAQAALAQAEGDAALARQALTRLIGESQPIELPKTEEPLPAAPSFHFPNELELSQLLKDGGLARPELEAARRAQSVSQLEAEIAGREGAPDLQLKAYRSTLGPTAEQGVQLSFIIPIFDWGRLRATRNQKRKLAEARSYDVEIADRKMLAELGTARTKYGVSFQKRKAMAELASQHLELAQTAQRGYEIGMLSLLEVLDAQSAFREGLRSYIQAEADYHRARVQLWWAAGRPLTEETSEAAGHTSIHGNWFELLTLQ
jgi:outer membrane protein TolC